MTRPTQISKSRLILGTVILIAGFLSPLLIPWVTSSGLPVGVKTVLSGLLAFGIPELFMLLAVAVMGKSGYEFIKAKLGALLTPLAPPDTVSPTRYHIGLVMFCIPIVFGALMPYAAHFFPSLKLFSLWTYIGLDLFFISSFFVLGGDFWDKLRGLFQYGVIAVKRPV